MLPVLLLVLGSCKEKSADPITTEITTNELTDYYLVAEHKTGGNRLAVMSFNKDGDVVKSAAHLHGILRINEVKVENSTFKFDYNSNGESVYTFTLRKDAGRKLQHKSYYYH